jgi:hypothetical protein
VETRVGETVEVSATVESLRPEEFVGPPVGLKVGKTVGETVGDSVGSLWSGNGW